MSERECWKEKEREVQGNLTPEASWAWRHPEGAGYAARIGRQKVGRRRWRRWRWCSRWESVGTRGRHASFLRIPLRSFLSLPLFNPFVFPHKLSFLFLPPDVTLDLLFFLLIRARCACFLVLLCWFHSFLGASIFRFLRTIFFYATSTVASSFFSNQHLYSVINLYLDSRFLEICRQWVAQLIKILNIRY